MAPEQLEGRAVDQRTDIHAMGIILYELATGQRLFPQEAPSQIVEAILHRSRNPPVRAIPISEGLERIIFKCLEKDPADRYASAQELIADLERLENGDLAGMIAGKLRAIARSPLRWRGRRPSRPRRPWSWPRSCSV